MRIRTRLSARRELAIAESPGSQREMIALQIGYPIDAEAEHYRVATALAEVMGLGSWPTFVGVDNQGRHYWEAFANAEAGTPIE